jgi:2-dehydro-3-deoxygluconokinase
MALPCSGAGRVVCFGEMLLRLSPPEGELPFQSPQLAAHFGGAEANVAASLAILGHDSAMVSALPDHVMGHAATGALRRHGVDTRGIRHAPGRMGLYLLSPGAMLRPTEVTYDRAGSVFALIADYDWPGLLRGARWLHLSGINLALGEATTAAAREAVRVARANGVAISFDCNHRAKLWGGRTSAAPGLLRELLSVATLAFGGARDMTQALGTPPSGSGAFEEFESAAQAAFAAFPQLQVLAATARQHEDVDNQALCGHLATREGALATRIHQLHGIVDRIGAGDAFAAGLLHGLLRGQPAQQALEFATAAACLKHSVRGDVNLLREADMLALVAGEGLHVRR